MFWYHDFYSTKVQFEMWKSAAIVHILFVSLGGYLLAYTIALVSLLDLVS